MIPLPIFICRSKLFYLLPICNEEFRLCIEEFINHSKYAWLIDKLKRSGVEKKIDTVEKNSEIFSAVVIQDHAALA